MKMPAFQFYPADWRKDPGIQALDRHDRSVWFDMLCIMHESDERGVLLLAGRPMPHGALSRMLAMSEADCQQTLDRLLEYGVASRREDGALYSRRMVKDEALRQVRAKGGESGGGHGVKGKEYGAKGGRPKKGTGDNKPPLLPPLNPPPSSSFTSTSTTEVVPASTPPRRLPLPAEDVQLFDAASWPGLNDPARFAAICAQLDYPQVNFERYRKQIISSLEGKQLPATSLRNWIKSYLNNDDSEGGLMLAAGAGQTPNEVPSNWDKTVPYVAPVGMGIPNMNSLLKPEFQIK